MRMGSHTLPNIKVTAKIHAAIETKAARYTGRIVEISDRGFQITAECAHVYASPKTGETATGELLVNGTLLKVTGQLSFLAPPHVSIDIDVPLDLALILPSPA